MELQERIEKLEKDIEGIKPKKKDIWDKMSALGSFMTPIIVALVGIFFTYQMKQAEIEANKTTAQAELNLNEQRNFFERKFRTAELIPRFLPQLLSKDEKDRKIAEMALIIVAPEDVTKLFEELKKIDPDRGPQLDKHLSKRRDDLIRQLFSNSSTLRLYAYNQLIANWANDVTIISDLISFGNQNFDNQNGVFNTVVFLSHMDKNIIKSKKKEIIDFSSKAELVGPETKKKVDELRSKLE